MNASFLNGLTPAQREAVLHVEGPLLILAGPGSGKTRTVTHRIAHLLHEGVHPRQILALTFTNKAAEEMRLRIERLAPDRPVWVGTFHRFCARTLRAHAALVGLAENFTIYDTADSGAVLRRAIEELQLEDTHFSPQQIVQAISWAKNNLILPEQYQPRPGSPLGSFAARIYPKYQSLLQRSNAVDFDDLLLHVATLLRESEEIRRDLDERYRFVMVDEYQDTNIAQYTIVRAISRNHPNLAVTGDPDQSIYGWRGANLRNILDFERDYPHVHVVRLEQNYRSTKRILRVADQLISCNKRRKVKQLFTDNEEGSPVRLVTYATHKDEAEGIAAQIATMLASGRRRPSDIAVFYRVNALTRSLEISLHDHGIPFQMIRGVEFYQRKEIKDVLGYLLLLNNPRDDVAFLRVINTPARGIGKSTLDRLREHAERYGMSMLQAAREAGLVETLAKKSAVAVARFVSLFDQLNIHASKPVEAILGHVLDATGYQSMLKDSEAEEDQDRLANIEELLTAAREFDEENPGDGHLEEFLEKTCLTNDTDDWDAVNDKVTLMTMHAAKGLEFPVVFVIAVEQGLIPHDRSTASEDQIEEERRLLFVAITRAEEELQLSLAKQRNFRGQQKHTVPSSFLFELPRDELDLSEPDNTLVDFNPAEWEEPSWDVSDENPMAASTLSPSLGGLKLTTAAQLAGDDTAADLNSPEAFAQGMLVTHPEYGLGKIVALSGSRNQRTGTVEFFSDRAQRKFVLAKSALRPIRSSQ